jgi:hypothetical protein
MQEVKMWMCQGKLQERLLWLHQEKLQMHKCLQLQRGLCSEFE